MEQSIFVHSPFAALSFIAAPALLTNATTVLAMSTINRLLRTRDRMHELFIQSESGQLPPNRRVFFLEQVNRVEKQAVLLLRALHGIYVALAAFVTATLVTLLGTSLAAFQGALWFRFLVGLGLVLGFVGVGGLVLGSVNLLRATQLSLVNIRAEADFVRQVDHGNPGPGRLPEERGRAAISPIEQ
ncbi:MAG: DUF2721 domain-containing protein [Verrucomicrobiota bacterium]